MKQRRFYPRQVLRALEGRELPGLGAGERCALTYFLRRARKLGQSIFLIQAPADLSSLAHTTEEQRRAVLQNCNTRIFLSMAPIVCVFDSGRPFRSALHDRGGSPMQFRLGTGVTLNPFSDPTAA